MRRKHNGTDSNRFREHILELKIYLAEFSASNPVFVDAETGVVYFNGMYPRYDANGRVMVIPRDRLPAILARGRAQAAAAAADEERKRTTIQV